MDTKECETKPSNQKLITGNYQIRGGENVLNEISNNILIETKNFPEFFEEFFLENSVRLKGLNVTVKIGSNQILNNKSDSDVKLNFGECPEILRINYSIKENEDNFLYKILELRINGTRLVKYFTGCKCRDCIFFYAFSCRGCSSPVEPTHFWVCC